MKQKLLYLLPFIIAFFSGCPSEKASAPTPTNIPTDTFSGTFKRSHTNSKTGAVDSLTAIIQVKMESSNYTVTGDTSTIQAGSFGTYEVNSYNVGILFTDKTYSSTSTSTKDHLNGIYEYHYDGTNLQMVAFGPLDTLSFYYNLNKTGN